MTFSDTVEAARLTFLDRECNDQCCNASLTPALAAVGTLAAQALASPLLQQLLARASIQPRSSQPLADVDGLLADASWDLALVLSPHKREVVAACDVLAPAADVTRVVDTLLRTGDRIVGLNTNTYASAYAVHSVVGQKAPGRVLLAGTGAAARSVTWGLHCLYSDSTEIGVIGRSVERANALVEQFGFGRVVDDPRSFAPEMVVNATTVGERDDSAALAVDLPGSLQPGVVFFDLNNRVGTLQLAALSAGCVVLSGLAMQIVTNSLRVALLKQDPTRG